MSHPVSKHRQTRVFPLQKADIKDARQFTEQQGGLAGQHGGRWAQAEWSMA